MFNITNFNKTKLYVVAFMASALFALMFWAVQYNFPGFLGGMSGVATVFVILLVLSSCLLLFVQRQIRQHAAIISALVDEVDDVVVIKDYEGNFVYCNQTVATLYNSTPRDMIGKDDYYFTKNKEQADFFRNNIQSVMQRFEKETVYESSTDAKTGDIRHFHSIKIPYRDAQDQLKIAVIAKDITELTQLKEEADRNKKRLEHVLDVSEEGLWEWNVRTNQVLHNRQWELITGIERSENTFQEFDGCILAEDKDKVHGALEMLLKHNKPYSIEFRMQRQDGRVIWIWDRGRVAEHDDNGQPIWIVGIAQDITAEKLNQQKVANLAYYDQLTGLTNRTQLEVELRHTILKSQQYNCYSALLFLDLDRFKLLNDSYGHHMGDKLLQAVATLLRQIEQDDVTISRFGGDEFVFVLSLLDASQSVATQKAQNYANTVIREISQSMHLKNELQGLEIEYSITGSIGGVVFRSESNTAEELLQLADMVLYRAKAHGGHSAMVFDANMQSDLRYASALQKNMRDSIAQGDFRIHLQPKYDSEERIIGAEALVRWYHPELGVLSPASFIDMAEESNLIIPIGEAVLAQACEKLKQWQANPLTEHLIISVNLSAKQIWQSHFVEDFIRIVESYGVDHSMLIVEVTESVLIQDVNDATEKLSELKRYGVSVSLDDFGTGYSSLSYLRALPIDEIKIDRSFISDLSRDKQAHLMVKSIIDLARNFNLRVVSEGVEEKEQFEFLKRFDVSKYQGYYFQPPISEAEFDELILRSLS